MDHLAKVPSFKERDILYGNRLKDVFENTSSGCLVVQRFIAGFGEALKMTRFHSPMLSKYYESIMLERTKQHFRLTLKYLFYVVLILFLESAVRDPLQHSREPHLIIIFCFPIILMYLLTLRNPVHSVYVWLSFVICISAVCTIFWARFAIIQQDHGLYSPSIVLLLCMFALLPIRTEFCISITVMCIISSVGLEVLQSHIPPLTSSATGKGAWIEFDLFKRLHFANRSLMASEEMTENVSIRVLPWIPIFFIALYLRTWNLVRMRFAFFKLGKNVKARRKCDEALRGQVRWIEAIMPAVVREEYQMLRQKNINSGAHMWVFNKAFDNVSILFADIVGFTRMSSNKKAHHVVTMLNNLFNRFDDLCQTCNCEKIGTLGDCYYCVSGCPVPQPNHAICCIEMGLGMCRIIKVFNCDFQESVSMRIGVHTGRVNAAIIGAQRFRFDVYSYDVIIASELESSGRAGRVHISQHVFDLVKHVYNVSEGEPLAVKKEQSSGIAGMELTKTYINTYFVDPRSAQWRAKHEKFGYWQSELRSLAGDIYSPRQPSCFGSTHESVTQEVNKTYEYDNGASSVLGIPWRDIGRDCSDERGWYVMQTFEDDLEFMYNLQTDPEKQYNLFRAPPLWPTSLNFCDAETEWHYDTHIKDSTRRTYIDSQKIAPLGDVGACLFLLIWNQLTLSKCIEKGTGVRPIYLTFTVFINFIGVVLCSFLVFVATTYDCWIRSDRLRRLYRLLIRPSVRELCTAIITMIPSLILFVTIKTHITEENVIAFRSIIGSVGFHCILIHCVPLSSSAWARSLCSIVSLFVVSQSLYGLRALDEQQRFCAGLTMFSVGIPYDKFVFIYMIELCVCVALVIFITRENERNCRLCFYVTRETEITSDESELAVKEAQDMLNNIIPNYVYNRLQLFTKDEYENRSFNYAVFVQHAGVAFATISNFFSKYYREDYKGGENALKLLNSIVCMFDSLLQRPEMKDVEKIKTINDCYMVAAGLNEDGVKGNPSELTHLIALMEYCHLLIDSLEEFNQMYIIGTDKFEVKIGYNAGPLIAGIIGTTKPMYDIWGNTVNVASRMYSTGLVGKIQVPNYVANKLRDYFKFVYRGDVFVKGKGDMQVYLCERL